MKLRLLDILACPADKHWPLKIHIFKEKKLKEAILPKANETTGVVCKYYCGKKKITLTKQNTKTSSDTSIKTRNEVNYTTDCKECMATEIIAGIIQCDECGGFYPIIEEIPIMLEEELRNQDRELAFVSKWSDKIKNLNKKK
ncbi:MAG: Trm112 family protein [Asgard group archaeon]|nr:Trm112 family protein [Asgard group archaeon]